MTAPLSRLLLVLTFLLSLVPQARAQFDPFAEPKFGRPAKVTAAAVLDRDVLPQGTGATLAVTLSIPPGLHTQSHTPLTDNLIPLVVTLTPASGVSAGDVIYPQPKIENYPALGRVSVYDGEATIYVPLKIAPDAPAGDITLSGVVSYQACDDKVCFAPEELPFTVQTKIVHAGTQTTWTNNDTFANYQSQAAQQAATPAAPPKAAAPDAKTLKSAFGDTYIAWFATALLAGLLFNVFPCVLPVLPLKAMSFFKVAGENRGRSFLLGTAFSLGIVLTFAALALLVVVFKKADWGQLFGSPWFAAPVTLVLLAVALSMFGAFDLSLPTGAYGVTFRQDTLTGNVLFGVFTAILSTPCTFGLFATLLLWAATQPEWLAVGVIMTAGFGMALPYLILSATPELARKFPKTGAWSNVVKQLMGFLLLAVAVYFGRVLLPDSLRGHAVWWVIAGLVMAGALFLVVRTFQIAPRVRPVAGAVVLAFAATASAGYVARQLTKPTVDWVHYTPAALEESRKTDKPVVVKFTADWCMNCQAIEATVYGDDDTRARLARAGVVPIKVDLTRSSAEGWPLLRSLTDVAAIQFTAVYLPGGEKPRVLTGIYNSAELMDALSLGTVAAK